VIPSTTEARRGTRLTIKKTPRGVFFIYVKPKRDKKVVVVAHGLPWADPHIMLKLI